MLYPTSTQAKNWIFTTEKLKATRDDSHERAKKKFDNAATSAYILTLEEENQLLHHYKSKIIDIGTSLNLPEKVTATAIVYMNRFYLKNSVMEHNPRSIMASTVFLACKTEDNHLEIDYYSQSVKTPPADITNLEMIILESLEFNLIIYHSYRPLYGYLLNISENSGLYGPISFDSFWEHSKKLVQKSLFSDICFFYHPNLVALAILDLTCLANQGSSHTPQQTSNLLKSYMENKLFPNKSPEEHVNITNQINEIKQAILAIPDNPDVNILKEIDKKLRLLSKKAKKEPTSKAPKKKQKTSSTSTPTPNTADTTTTNIVIKSEPPTEQTTTTANTQINSITIKTETIETTETTVNTTPNDVTMQG
ncbi:hypothetical protein CYY_000363 [Polysphondylium violaceum]|uniref:Cyclin-like domain-containing protein n=1 Tax=Polysphondylium violaceum TaxID=133409 RepID=A0A8J4Q320_9MYCE|nr:hypothetical protein CYY_000363 [Polysphondylium violaceum]